MSDTVKAGKIKVYKDNKEIDIIAIKGDNYVLTDDDKKEIKNAIRDEILAQKAEDMEAIESSILETIRTDTIIQDQILGNIMKIQISDDDEYDFITKEDIPFIQSGVTSSKKIPSAGADSFKGNVRHVEFKVAFPIAFKSGTKPNVVCCLNWTGKEAKKIAFLNCVVNPDYITNSEFVAKVSNVSPFVHPNEFEPTLGLQWIAVGQKGD